MDSPVQRNSILGAHKQSLNYSELTRDHQGLPDMDYELLSNIRSPKDIKDYTIIELEQLAKEIRHRIIDVLSITGGHLASNLGIVELTIALHKVFNSPEDMFIWDVSHQSYVHKLLTGRNDQFDKIRQYQGLSGFTNPKESHYDHFFAGHAGTALSLALGSAARRDLNNQEEYIIPIIGDATLTCGLTLEALNNVDRNLKKFIVILNDNEMSISKNVGAITKILSRILSNPTTNKILQEVDALINKVPGYGTTLSKHGHKITESIKNLVSPAAFFEQFQLSYIGPIDGHDIQEVIEALEGVKDSQWPVLMHVITKKGQGMEEAIKNPVTWHGAKPFCPNTCKTLPNPSSKPTFPNVFGEHLLRMAERDADIICVTPAMSAGSCLDPMLEKYPSRCIDVGIAEGHAVTFAGGIAADRSLKVFASVYSTFLQRAFDNVFHDVCLQEIPVVFAIDRAGIAGGDGHTHNGIYDISFLNAMPNMIIAQPRDGLVLKELMESAHSWGHPAAIRYPNLPVMERNEQICQRDAGKGEILNKGRDILLIGLGHMAYVALDICKALQEKGYNPTVLDPIFVKPLDTQLLHKLLITHHKIITLEEHSVVSGLGAIINNFLMTSGYNDVQTLNFGVPETFVAQGKHSELMNEIGLSAEKILSRIEQEFLLDIEQKEEAVSVKFESLL